nr:MULTISPECIES: DUF5753 domain-containing protein [unclassified Streptomyces]
MGGASSGCTRRGGSITAWSWRRELRGFRNLGRASFLGCFRQRRIFGRWFRECNPGAEAEETDGLVAARLSRQEALHRDNPQDCWWILNEAAVRQTVGGPSVMREQLSTLLPLVQTKRTTIQVVPFEAGACALMNGTLILLTLPDNSTTVYQEGAGSGEIFDNRETVMRQLRDYDRMKACALPQKASAALIEAAMENFSPCEPTQT